MIDYQTVASTNVQAVGYDSESGTLGVCFNSGSEYHYYGVPVSVFEGVWYATSVGSYIDQVVKKAGYAYARVR